VKARNRIGSYRFISMADVWLSVGIADRRGDVIGFAGHNFRL
jgi:hypothetical protein